MRSIAILFAVFLYLTICFSFCYSQVDINKDPYYDQFKPEYWQQEQRANLFSVLIAISPIILGLLGIIAISFERKSLSVLLFGLAFLFWLGPSVIGFIESARIEANENQTTFSRDPLSTMRKYPLEYGMSKEEVLGKWGKPRDVQYYTPLEYNAPQEEHWFYSRRKPFKMGTRVVIFVGWENLYGVTLVFVGDSLEKTYPDIDWINKARVAP